MDIFPYSLVRIAGSSFNELHSLRIYSILIDEIYDLKKQKKYLKNKIVYELYNLIGNLSNTHQQNLLLNLKRNIYNDRFNSSEELTALLPLINKDIEKIILNYLSVKNILKENELLFELEYEKQVENVRTEFKNLIDDGILQKGLLLSSNNLLKRINPYINKETAHFSRNDFKAELGLLKYLTRVKTKTSPFSTFTNLAIAKHKSPKGEKSNFDTKDISVESHVRLNNKMYAYLKNLMFKFPDIYLNFHISLNPTIQQENDQFIFLTNHNNIESFQSITANPFLFLINNKIHKNKSISFNELLFGLMKNVEASKQDISDYIHELISFGFLEFDLSVSESDPDWDLQLRDVLHPLDKNKVPFIAELRQTLRIIRNIAIKYEAAELKKREYLLKEAFDIFKAFCMKLHEAAGLPEEERMNKKSLKIFLEKKGKQKNNKQAKLKKAFKKNISTWFNFKPETIFYEDTSIKNPMKIDTSSLEDIIGSVNRMLIHLQPFEGWQAEKEKMIDYFTERYGKENSANLLSFYKNYYLDVKKIEATKSTSKDVELNPLNKKANNTSNGKVSVSKWKDDFANLLKPLDNYFQGTVLINENHLLKASKQNSLKLKPIKRSSFGMFIQLFLEKKDNGEEQLKGVINGIFPGFGRMMSRFLHLFDNEITEEIRNWNDMLAQNDLLVENCDASCFNANIHPPLLPMEIKMPGSQNTLPIKQQIPVTDLIIQLKEGDLYLKNSKDNKVLYVFDLGFQGFKGRSPLFHLLSKFTLAKFFYPQILISAVNKHISTQIQKKSNELSGIKFNPRVTFEENIILQRKKWFVPKSLLPLQMKKENDAFYFLRVNEWRKNIDIPEEIFITIISKNSETEINNKKKNEKIGKDDYKPQFIDFHNPLLVKLFSKVIKKVPVSLTIEEMLPTSNQLKEFGNKKYVTEHMVQWYNF